MKKQIRIFVFTSIFCFIFIMFSHIYAKDIVYSPDAIIGSYNISAMAGKILPRAKLIKKIGKIETYQLTPFSFLNIEANSRGKAISAIFIGGGDGTKESATISLLSAVTFVTSLQPTIKPSILRQLGITDGKMRDLKERSVTVLDMKITSQLVKSTGFIISVLPAE